MPITIFKNKSEFDSACKKAKKLAREKKYDYIVYWSDEYHKYRVIPEENLMRYDNGTPFEEILFWAEA